MPRFGFRALRGRRRRPARPRPGGQRAPPPGEGRTGSLRGQAAGTTWRRRQRGRASEGRARAPRHTHAHRCTRTHTRARVRAHARTHLPLAVRLHQLAQRGVPLDLELDHGAVLAGHLQVDVVVLRLHALLQETHTGPWHRASRGPRFSGRCLWMTARFAESLRAAEVSKVFRKLEPGTRHAFLHRIYF